MFQMFQNDAIGIWWDRAWAILALSETNGPPQKKTKRPLRVEETGRWQMPHEGGGPGNLGIFTRLNEQFLGNPKLSFILGTNKYPLVN